MKFNDVKYRIYLSDGVHDLSPQEDLIYSIKECLDQIKDIMMPVESNDSLLKRFVDRDFCSINLSNYPDAFITNIALFPKNHNWGKWDQSINSILQIVCMGYLENMNSNYFHISFGVVNEDLPAQPHPHNVLPINLIISKIRDRKIKTILSGNGPSSC